MASQFTPIAYLEAVGLSVSKLAPVNARAYAAVESDGIENPALQSLCAAFGTVGGYLGGLGNALLDPFIGEASTIQLASQLEKLDERDLLRREGEIVVNQTTPLTPGSSQFNWAVDDYVRAKKKERGL